MTSDPKPPLIGIQTAAFSICEEGVDRYLDCLQEAAKANAVFILPDSSPGFLAADETSRPPHCGAVTPYEKTICPPHDERFYRNLKLRPPGRQELETPRYPVVELDVFEELREATEARGMKLYARLFQSGNFSRRFPGSSDVAQVDCFGRLDSGACLNHPELRSFEKSRIEDLVTNHPYLDGLNYLQERGAGLAAVISKRMIGNGQLGKFTCFCEHCRRKGHEKGIDPERAAAGARRVTDLILEHLDPDGGEEEGVFFRFLRLLMEYPEVLAWEKLWGDSLHDFRAELYGTAKGLAPQMDIGWHIHQGIVLNPLIRLMLDYRRIARYADHIKPTIYPGCLGARTNGNWQNGLFDGIFRDLRKSTALNLMYDLLQLDPASMPTQEQYESGGKVPPFGSQHASSEVRRAVAGAGGRSRIYAGVGFDIPGHQDTPEEVYRHCQASLDAGADGLLLCREYHEMQYENLEACGRAITDHLTS